MHSDWFNGIDILQVRWQHGKKVEYCYPSGLEKALCKWKIHVPLVTKGLTALHPGG
jgi:ribosomal protein L32E